MMDLYHRRKNRIQKIEGKVFKQDVPERMGYTLNLSSKADNTYGISFFLRITPKFVGIEKYIAGDDIYYCARFDSKALCSLDTMYGSNSKMWDSTGLDLSNDMDKVIGGWIFTMLCNAKYYDRRDMFKDMGLPGDWQTELYKTKTWADGREAILKNGDFRNTVCYKTLKKYLSKFDNTEVAVSRNPKIYPKVKDYNLYPFLHLYEGKDKEVGYADDNLHFIAEYFHGHPSVNFNKIAMGQSTVVLNNKKISKIDLDTSSLVASDNVRYLLSNAPLLEMVDFSDVRKLYSDCYLSGANVNRGW